MDYRDTAVEMLRQHHGRYVERFYGQQASRLASVLENHPNARLEACADENTGLRFGRADCRRGRCKKIGSSGWSSSQPGSHAYQLWAVWALRKGERL